MMSHRGFGCKEDLNDATQDIMERYDIDESGQLDSFQLIER